MGAIDETEKTRVTAAAREYDSRVAGAVSPQPGLVLGEPGAAGRRGRERDGR